MLGLVGGYLVVTATSSAQQRGLASMLGGSVPEKKKHDDESTRGVLEEMTELPVIPPAFRLMIGTGGAVLLLVAFTMVFGTALDLLANPVQPTDIPTLDQLLSGRLFQ